MRGWVGGGAGGQTSGGQVMSLISSQPPKPVHTSGSTNQHTYAAFRANLPLRGSIPSGDSPHLLFLGGHCYNGRAPGLGWGGGKKKDKSS